MWQFETALSKGVADQTGEIQFAGVDEVGRGCLAGPVVAAAVIRPNQLGDWISLYDSKATRSRARHEMYTLIQETAQGVGIGICSPEEIDTWNILAASRIAMGRALIQLQGVSLALIDGLHSAMETTVPCLPVVHGDARCTSIAAASIIAKVIRDQIMVDYDKQYPGYGFVQNVGYGTKEHLQALNVLGPTPIHRFTFSPVVAVSQVSLQL